MTINNIEYVTICTLLMISAGALVILRNYTINSKNYKVIINFLSDIRRSQFPIISNSYDTSLHHYPNKRH